MVRDKADKLAARIAKKAEAAARRESAEQPSAPRTAGVLASELPMAYAIPVASPFPRMATLTSPQSMAMTPAQDEEPAPVAMPVQVDLPSCELLL